MTEHNSITTADGIPVGDNQNSLTAGDMPQPNGVNRLGSFMGMMGQTTPDFTGGKGAELDSGDRLSCELYGQRIAAAVKRWQK